MGWIWHAPFAWYQTHFGATGLKVCLMVLSLKSTSLGNLHQGRWCWGWGKGQESMQGRAKASPSRYAKPYFSPVTSYTTWLQPPTTNFHFKYKTSPYTSTVSKWEEGTVLSFWPSWAWCCRPVTQEKALTNCAETQERCSAAPTASSASRKAGSCLRLSAHFVLHNPQFLLINHTTELWAVWY